jgi:hypothetical protein
MGGMKLKCNNFFKGTNIEEQRGRLIVFLAEIISFKIKDNKEI